jgi:hypothetical protein
MSTLQERPTLAADTPAMLTTSPSMSSISTSSDDAPQLSFEYIWDDDGNFVRISKTGPSAENIAQHSTQPDASATPLPTNDTLLNDVLGNEHTAENAQSIASVLSLSQNATSVRENLSSPDSASRQFQRTVSGPVVSSTSQRASLLTPGARPLVRARRVPIEEKRKEEAEMDRKNREEEEREREARRLRMREKEKENWFGGIDVHAKGECSTSLPVEDASIHTCLARTLSRSSCQGFALVLAHPHSIRSQPLTSCVARAARTPVFSLTAE